MNIIENTGSLKCFKKIAEKVNIFELFDEFRYIYKQRSSFYLKSKSKLNS